MRIQHWLTAIMSLLAPLVVGATSLAQSGSPWAPQSAPGRIPAGYYPAVDANGYPAATPPPMFQPAFSNNNPQALYPPTAPQTMQPWPQISPIMNPDVAYDRVINRDGIWLNDVVRRNRQYYGSVEYLQSFIDGATGAQVGSKTAVIRNDTLDFQGALLNTWPLGGPINGSDIGPVLYPVGPGVYPFVFVQADTDDFPGVVTLLPLDIFPIRNTSVFRSQMSNPGFRVRAGYRDGDGTGLSIEGWFGFQSNETFQIGSDKINGVPITQDLIAGVDLSTFVQEDLPDEFDTGFFQLPFTKTGALPLAENSGAIDFLFPGAGFTGTTTKFDLMYRLDYATQAGGGNINYYLGHIYKRPDAEIASFVSARYLYVDEYFRFHGLDSGFHYDIDLGSDPPTFRPDGSVIGPIYPLFEAELRSTTTSNLAGPELGLRGDLGRADHFKMWWTSSVGLMANHERGNVAGYNIGNPHFFNANIGDPADANDDSGFGVLDPSLNMFANDTTFNNTKSHMHVSPTFSLGINAELDVLGVLPYIEKVSLFDHANLNFGYNLLVVGKLARADNSINWRGFPEFPSSVIRRDTWWAHQFSVGLAFER